MHIGLFLVPGFGFLGLAAIMEILFQANKRLPDGTITWETLSANNETVVASSGASLQPDRSLVAAEHYDVVIVFGAAGAASYSDRAVSNWLRFQDAHGARLGSVMSGAWLLAQAGLLNDFRCSIHWQEIEAFAEAFPMVKTSSDIYVIDRSRFSCSGGHVCADMMLYLLSEWFGPEIVTEVRETLFHDRLRDPGEAQRFALESRIGSANPFVLRAIEIFETHTDNPPTIEQVSRKVGVSQRRLEQLFARHFRRTPKQYQLQLRLERAKSLLVATALPIREIALITGFQNPRHFSTAYKNQFGQAPSSARK